MVRGKRILLFSVFSSLLLLSAAAPGWAYPLKVGDVISLSDGPGTTNGGEFKVNLINPTFVSDIFRTFCLEKLETFYYGQHLTVARISDFAMAGGGGASDGKDYIDAKTRYLYYHFSIGDLVGYDYENSDLIPGTRTDSANMLRLAIWHIEGELDTTTFNPDFNFYTRLAYDQIIAGNTIGIDNVRALNLIKPDGTNAQDQLTMVPEPGALLSLGIVLLGLGGVTRRRFRK